MLIFYNIECALNPTENKTHTHEPILCISQTLCDKCVLDRLEIFGCNICGQNKERVFENTPDSTCIEKFVEYLDSYRNGGCPTYCIAHNAKSYDLYFVLNVLSKRNKPIVPIMNGMKFLKVTYNSFIHFIDSINFLPMALSKFNQTFGLPDTEKGDFPIFFPNRNYVGEIPEIKYFPIERMNEERLLKFKEWHGQQKKERKIFNFRDELIKYCTQDVKILRQGCVKFMLDFIDLTGVNPFTQSFTLAQAARSGVYLFDNMFSDILDMDKSIKIKFNNRGDAMLEGWKGDVYVGNRLCGEWNNEFRFSDNMFSGWKLTTSTYM